MPPLYIGGMSVVACFVSTQPNDVVFFSDGRECWQDGSVRDEYVVKTLRISDTTAMGVTTGNTQDLAALVQNLYRGFDWPRREDQPDEPITNFVEKKGWVLSVDAPAPFLDEISGWLRLKFGGKKSSLLIAVGSIGGEAGASVYVFSRQAPYSWARDEFGRAVLLPASSEFEASDTVTSAAELVGGIFPVDQRPWDGRIEEFCREALGSISKHYGSINCNLMLRRASYSPAFDLVPPLPISN